MQARTTMLSVFYTVILPVTLGAIPAPAVQAQQPPISDQVGRGLPRPLVVTRSDDQLAALLTSARPYTVYTFQLGGNLDQSRIRRWNGMLVMPRASELGKLATVQVAAPRGGTAVDSWYTHADGTLSKLVLDASGKDIGVLSIRGSTMWVNVDLNRDGVVDFHRTASLDANEMVAVMDGEGAAFLARWRRGENMLCSPRDKSAPGIPGRSRDKASMSPIAAGTIPMCGETSEESGPLAGIDRGGHNPPPDPMDRLCAGRASGISIPGMGPRLDGPGAAGGAGVAGAAAGPSSAPPPSGPSANRERTAQWLAERVYVWILKPPKTEKDPARREQQESAGALGTGRGSQPVVDGGRAGSSDASMTQLCTARARADRRWSVIDIAEGERQRSGAAETNCDDPVTDPAAADAAKTMPKCGPNRDTRSVSERVLEGLGAYQQRQCGRLERPGPDGTCRGSRTIGAGRGQLWYGYGSVIGLIPCDGIACDPKSESR